MEKSEFNELLNMAFKNRVETIRKPDKDLLDKQYQEILRLNEENKALREQLSTYQEDSDTLSFVVDRMIDVGQREEDTKFFICCDELGEIMKGFETFLGPFMTDNREKCKDC